MHKNNLSKHIIFLIKPFEWLLTVCEGGGLLTVLLGWERKDATPLHTSEILLKLVIMRKIMINKVAHAQWTEGHKGHPTHTH